VLQISAIKLQKFAGYLASCILRMNSLIKRELHQFFS